MIDIEDTETPLIDGRFDTDDLMINGDLNITGNLNVSGNIYLSGCIVIEGNQTLGTCV